MFNGAGNFKDEPNRWLLKNVEYTDLKKSPVTVYVLSTCVPAYKSDGNVNV